ncbi:MAG: DDE-type integrase/transposase/recombinase [Pseudomonadota bacterium]|nr:DDE-type integrase/transposase/recombinase [Pseudomonadota bacterium]
MTQSNGGALFSEGRKTRRYDLEFKRKVIERVVAGESVPAICRDLGITAVGTVHGWIYKHRRNNGITADSMKKSRRPHHQPKLTSQWIVDKILKIKKEKPEMGAKAMSDHLLRFESVNLSHSTIAKVFKKHNVPDGDAGAAEASFRTKGDNNKQLEQQVEKEIGEWQRFSRPHPNDLWQMDIMGFYIRDAHKVYLISAIDDCSRMIVGWGLFREQMAENVLEVLRGSLVRFGAPKEILTDQGAQFKHWGGITQFEKLLKKLKVEHITARSHHPQTCGKIEAFHKSIHRELIDKEFFVTQEQAVEKIARFIEHYNYGRPHSALDGFTPSDRYFGIVESLKKYISDYQAPKNKDEEKSESMYIIESNRQQVLIF